MGTKPSRFKRKMWRPRIDNKDARDEVAEDVEIKELGGGWYEVSGVRIRGREDAEAYRDQVNA